MTDKTKKMPKQSKTVQKESTKNAMSLLALANYSWTQGLPLGVV